MPGERRAERRRVLRTADVARRIWGRFHDFDPQNGATLPAQWNPVRLREWCALGRRCRKQPLRQLELQLKLPVKDAGKETSETFEVVPTILGPHDDEEMEDAPMRESLAHHLAHRAVRDIQAKAAGRTVVGIADSRCDSSDEANCEGDEGETVNAFVAGRRCYRLVLHVAVRSGT